MSEASLAQWLQRLESLHPTEMELGLDRISAVANALQLLPVAQEVITVAGTNGKGSTVAVLESLLSEMACVTGACTSPHLFKFNERIRVAGLAVSDGEIIQAFEQIERARGDVSLTYFEFACLAALLIFRSREVDVIILEVGLGGRLDAVNMVDATVAVICSIDLDHQDWLGDSREKIAREKAGILRSEQYAVIAETNPPASLRERVNQLQCKAYYSGEHYSLEEAAGSWRAQLCTQDGQIRQVLDIPSGPVLADNICAAAQAVLLTGREFSDQQLRQALGKVQLRGRRELQEIAGKEYLLDVAHNPASLNKLLEYMDVNPCNGTTISLFSVMADKDCGAMIQACEGRFDAWFTADQPSNSRAARGSDIATQLHARGHKMVSISKNIRQAFRRAQSLMTEGDRLVVFGSFYTVAEVLPLLEKDKKKG
jgi:dihydrofolate synthase/folylpolyglutamate synthase